MNMNLDWAQKYRPTAIQDVILPTNLKAIPKGTTNHPQQQTQC